MATKYKADLKAAEEILQELLDFKEHVETRIAMQKRKIAALRELSDMSDDADAPLGLVTGITDAVRSFMRASEPDRRLSLSMIAAGVETLGIPPQKNLLASVTTVVRRMVNDTKEIREYPGTPTTYSWIRKATLDLSQLLRADTLSGVYEGLNDNTLTALGLKPVPAWMGALSGKGLPAPPKRTSVTDYPPVTSNVTIRKRRP